jgi:hypothetical protein
MRNAFPMLLAFPYEIYLKNVNLNVIRRSSQYRFCIHFSVATEGKFCACSRFMDKKNWKKKKIETFLIYPLHCTKCKMRNEKEKLFSRYLPQKKLRLQCLPVTLNLYFSVRFFAFFQTIKHFSLLSFSLLSVEVDAI